MSINTTLTDPITINNNVIETVEDFTYLGSIKSADNGTQKDITSRCICKVKTCVAVKYVQQEN